MTDLFVYGALMYKDVREALLGHDYETTDATLQGHTRKETKELPYPALIKQPGTQVQGILLRNIHTPDLIVLDKFHTDHKRTLIHIETNNKEIIASTYTPKEHVEILENDWSEETLDYAAFYLEHIIPAFFKNLNK